MKLIIYLLLLTLSLNACAADTNFISGVTKTDAAWFQDVNNFTYRGGMVPAAADYTFRSGKFGIQSSGSGPYRLVLASSENLTAPRTITFGTGNANRAISLTGDFATTGGNPVTFITTGSTTLTLPTSGTLLTSSGGGPGSFTTLAASGATTLGTTLNVGGATRITTANGTQTLFELLQTGIANWQFKNLATTGVLSIEESATPRLTVQPTGAVAVLGNASVGGQLTVGASGRWFSAEAGGSSYWTNAAAGLGSGIFTNTTTVQTVISGTGVMTVNGAGVIIPGTLSVTGHPTFEGVTSTGATGSGNLVFSTSPTLVAPVLGTPASGVATNLTGTASGLSIGGNAATATTATNQSGGTVSATTGNFSSTATATAFIPSGSTVPTNGLYLPAANTLGWATNTTNWMNLDATGGVLINTASRLAAYNGAAVTGAAVQAAVASTTLRGPTNGLLSVTGDSGSGTIVSESMGSANNPGAFYGYRSKGSAASPAVVVSGDNLAAFGAVGGTSTSSSTPFASAAITAVINMVATETYSGSAQGSRIDLYTTPNGSNAAALTVRADQDGSVTMPRLGASSGATTGTLCWTTGTGLINVNTTLACLASSGRFKQNVHPLDMGLAQVMQLRPVAYSLKPEYDPTNLGEQIGLVAEDVAKVDQRLVGMETDGMTPQGVRYMQMAALLVKAIQEQQEQLDFLKREVVRLRQQNETYSAQLR